ncbi:uncharacterized protein F58A4.6 [Nilaparvata lugens]|uniref:uncharacterized protein F58A4.6 n=1 Tax=Nilaparvata lugens TaxID=108931 RepID=UPI00193E45DD|nr:uncharacterized protein F58A4.6 [Nilaparvata lugens]
MTVLHFKLFVNHSELWDNLFLYSTEDFHSCIRENERKPVSTSYSNSFHNQEHLPFVTIYKVQHDSIINSSNVERLYDSKFSCVSLNKKCGDSSDIDESFIRKVSKFESPSRKSKKNSTIAMSGYSMTQFLRTLVYSQVYRKLVIRNCVVNKKIRKDYFCVEVKLKNEGSFIDHRWFERIERLYIERRELDNIMSWLSTLGGGFSALGEYQPAFALKAGQISCDQMKLALRLGDDLVVARCKLYFSLSLIQRGYLKPARKVIEEQFKFATNHIVLDQRLVNMCKGIWAKLKYEHRLRCNRKRIK